MAYGESNLLDKFKEMDKIKSFTETKKNGCKGASIAESDKTEVMESHVPCSERTWHKQRVTYLTNSRKQIEQKVSQRLKMVVKEKVLLKMTKEKQL